MPAAARSRPRAVRLTRSAAILHLKRRLEAQSYPRLQMSLIVALTGGAGLVASWALLQAGVTSMAWRYPLALAGAYLVFLGLLWVWLRAQASDFVDAAPDIGDPFLSGGGGGGGGGIDLSPGGGGDFAGGGASASFDTPGLALADGGGSSSSGSSALGDVAGGVLEGDDILIPLLVILLALGLALASLYIVYSAPALLAELLFDGTLSLTLYRRLRRTDDSPNWLLTAVRKTALPFALTAVFLGGVGLALGHFAPGARTVGEALARAAG